MKIPRNAKSEVVDSARRFAEDTRHAIWQKSTGPDDGISKPQIQGFVDTDGAYLMLLQDGRPVAFTFESVDDVIGLLVTLKAEATQIRRTKRAEQQ